MMVKFQPNQPTTNQVVVHKSNAFDALGVKVINDPTGFGIETFLRNLSPEDRRKLHHIIIPDLERVSSRSSRIPSVPSMQTLKNYVWRAYAQLHFSNPRSFLPYGQAF